MTALVWDAVGEKKYETGVDRGVLYLPNGSAVPWNGLTSVSENTNVESSPTYYDGRKVNNLLSVGDYTGTLKAFMYPEEFEVLEGLGKFQNGVFLGEQRPQPFGLSYRTKVGNDLNQDAGYKIYIIYNVTAFPAEKSFETMSDSVTPVEFEWDLTAIPEDVPGFAPTARIIINTTEIDPTLLASVEAYLYGTDEEDASLPSMNDLLTTIGFPTLLAIKIVDNGDGTWTATGDGVTVTGDTFEIDGVDTIMLDTDTYRISSTRA